MKSRSARYPDISDILARKAAGRRYLAALSFGDKLDMLDLLRERTAPMRRTRPATPLAPRSERSKAPKK